MKMAYIWLALGGFQLVMAIVGLAISNYESTRLSITLGMMSIIMAKLYEMEDKNNK